MIATSRLKPQRLAHAFIALMPVPFRRSAHENPGIPQAAGPWAGTETTVKLAAPTGFEPVTYRLGGGCSVQLSYEAAKWQRLKIQ